MQEDWLPSPAFHPSTIRREENKETSTSRCCRGNNKVNVDLSLSIKGGKPVRPSLSLSLQTSPCLRPRWEERREEIITFPFSLLGREARPKTGVGLHNAARSAFRGGNVEAKRIIPLASFLHEPLVAPLAGKLGAYYISHISTPLHSLVRRSRSRTDCSSQNGQGEARSS